MLLEEVLEQSARRRPGACALVFGDTRLSYAELDALADRAARGLRERGVGRGDRVAIHLDVGVELVVAVFAALKAGASFTMMHPSTKPQKIGRLCRDLEPRAIFVPPIRLAPLQAEGALDVDGLAAIVCAGEVPPANTDPRAVSYAALTAPAPASADVDRDAPLPKAHIDVDLAAILYTSGSTGESKGVMLTHLNMVSALRAIERYLGVTEDDVVFCPLSLSFSYGLSNLFVTLLAGGRFVIEKTIAYRAATLTKMATERVTGMPMVPTMATLLLADDLAKFDLSSLRWITNAGAALPGEHVKRVREVLPNVSLYCMYGQTECVRAAYLDPSLALELPSSVGRPIPNTDAWVVGEDGRRAGPGVVGELVVRGAHIMRGYWKKPEETAKKLRDGPVAGEKVLHTGDLFRTDERGNLHFVERTDDVIKSRGEKVAPREVEDALVALEGVVEAAVIGVADPVLGAAVKAFIVTEPGVTLTRAQVLQHCARRLEDFMLPTVVEFRTELPRTDSGKVAKRELR